MLVCCFLLHRKTLTHTLIYTVRHTRERCQSEMARCGWIMRENSTARCCLTLTHNKCIFSQKKLILLLHFVNVKLYLTNLHTHFYNHSVTILMLHVLLLHCFDLHFVVYFGFAWTPHIPIQFSHGKINVRVQIIASCCARAYFLLSFTSRSSQQVEVGKLFGS